MCSCLAQHCSATHPRPLMHGKDPRSYVQKPLCDGYQSVSQQGSPLSVSVTRRGFSPPQMQRPVYEPGAQGPSVFMQEA